MGFYQAMSSLNISALMEALALLVITQIKTSHWISLTMECDISIMDFLLKEGVITDKVFSITRSNHKSEVLTRGDYDKKLFNRKNKGK